MPSAQNVHGELLSPGDDKFSTPPTSPHPMADHHRPSLSRKNSRPTSLTLNQNRHDDFVPDILLEESSPGITRRPLAGPTMLQESSVTPRNSQHDMQNQALKSPCFVHSHLDKGASLTEWLRDKNAASDLAEINVTHALHDGGDNFSTASSQQSYSDSMDDEVHSHNLTRQLAETAVGVREMSKQLGTWYNSYCLTKRTFFRPILFRPCQDQLEHSECVDHH